MRLLNRTRNILDGAKTFRAQDDFGVFIGPETYEIEWTSTNSVLSINSQTYVHPLQYSLKVQPNDEVSAIVITLNGVSPAVPDINGSRAQFHCQIYGIREMSVSAKLTDVVNNNFVTYAQSTTINQWSPVFSPEIDLGIIDLDVDVIEFNIELTVTNHSGQVFYMSVPTLMNALGFTKNVFVTNMRKFIPTFIWDKDKIQEYPNYPFTKLFDILTRGADNSTILYRKFFHYFNYQLSSQDLEEDFRYSELIDPTHVDSDYQNWLSYLNGTQLYKSITASNAAEVIDNVDESLTWQLTDGYFGRNAGTVEAIKECTKQVLTGSKVVYVFSGGSFFQINVYTLLSQTPGVVNSGDTSPQVESMLERTKPMGFVLNHEAFASLPLILDSSVYGILGTAALG